MARSKKLASNDRGRGLSCVIIKGHGEMCCWHCDDVLLALLDYLQLKICMAYN